LRGEKKRRERGGGWGRYLNHIPLSLQFPVMQVKIEEGEQLGVRGEKRKEGERVRTGLDCLSFHLLCLSRFHLG